MPRANRYYQEGFVYHITHRCHQRTFLLERKKDKRRYRYWLYRAVKRYNLCVLNFVITSNHIHLLVLDTGSEVISNSMRYISARVAFEYNRRKKLDSGGFWEGRYFATAVQKETYLLRCMVYIALNMVRCKVVSHPREWQYGGYYELRHPRKRYRIIQETELISTLGYKNTDAFLDDFDYLIEQAILNHKVLREPEWTEQPAVGDLSYKTRFLE